MIITNIEQYEAASEEERAVWLCAELFQEFKEDRRATGPIYYEFIAIERLQKFYHVSDLIKWLASPEGCDAVERAMIAKGYCCFSESGGNEWNYAFECRLKGGIRKVFTSYEATKAKALHHAAAKALLAESV